MKRLHIHLSIPDLQQAIHFYSEMFGQQPTRQKSDYAKWQLEDPAVNFAVSTRSSNTGLDHLGLQADDEAELNALQARLNAAEINTGAVENTVCCYAESSKAWTMDPAGIPWESFVTMKEVETFGVDKQSASENQACCAGAAPQQTQSVGCC